MTNVEGKTEANERKDSDAIGKVFENLENMEAVFTCKLDDSEKRRASYSLSSLLSQARTPNALR